MEAATQTQRQALLQQKKLAAKQQQQAASNKAVSSVVQKPSLKTTTYNQSLEEQKARFERQEAFNAKLQRARKGHFDRVRQYQQLPPVIEQNILEDDPLFQQQLEDDQRQYAQLQATTEQQPLQGYAQKHIEAAKAEIHEKIQQEVKDKIKKVAKKNVKKLGWNTYNNGSILEIEGLSGWVIFLSGVFFTIFRAVKTLFMKGNFFSDKSILSWVEPPRIDPKDPQDWVSIMYAILLILILIALFAFVVLFLIIFILPIALGELDYWESFKFLVTLKPLLGPLIDMLM